MAQARPCLLLMVTLALAVTTAAGPPTSDPEWIAHMSHVAAFSSRCGTPRPAAIHIGEYIKGHDSNGKAYSPNMTVLHRCDPGACCCLVKNDTCVPSQTRNVTLVFLAVYTIRAEGHAIGQQVLERYTAVNHTRCACLNELP